MTTLELLREVHDAIGNTYPDWNTLPPKIAIILPELRVKIRQLELKEKERINGQTHN